MAMWPSYSIFWSFHDEPELHVTIYKEKLVLRPHDGFPSPPTGRALAFALTLRAMSQPTALTVSPARPPPCDDSAWSLRKQRAQLHRRLTVLQAHMTTNPAAPGDESDDDGDESDVCVLHLHELRTGLAEIDRLITRVSQECSCATTGIVCGVLSPKCSRPRFTARGMGASS